MRVDGKVIAVTGGGSGLGAEACRLAAARGAAGVAVIDLDADKAAALAAEFGGLAVAADIGSEAGVVAAVAAVTDRFGTVDIFVSNAGHGSASDPFTDDSNFTLDWNVHVMSNVWAARALLPAMLERGHGHLSATASSNAMTTNPVSLSYAVTKHAQLAVAEWLAMTYGSRGIEASCFCPKGMLTPMLLAGAEKNAYARSALVGAVPSEEAGRMLLDMIESGQTIATTYPPVLEDFALRSTDHGAFIARMRELHDLVPDVGMPPVAV